MKIKILIVASLFTGMLVSGCMVGPNFQAPEIETRANYRFDSLQVDTMANLAWWELFQDTVLHGLIRMAIDSNLTVRQAAARIEEARAFTGFTKADLYPRIDIDASLSGGNSIKGPSNLGRDQTNIGVSPFLAWEIDFWGKFRRANRAAQNELLATQYGQRTVMVELISAVATTYFQLLGFKAQHEIAIQTYQARQASTTIIQARFDRGTAAEIDLNQAQIQEAIAQSAIPLFERLVAKSENALSVLLGQPPGPIGTESLQAQVLPPDVPPGLPSQLLARRPDLQEAYYYLAAQHEQIGIAEAQRLPSISLTGLFGVASNELNTLFTADGIAWSIAGSLTGPLFNFGKNKRRVEIAQQQYEQALLNYQQRVLVAFQEVEDALVEVQTYRQEIFARNRQFEAADNAKGLSDARYFGGQTSYLEVLESDRQRFNASIDLAAAFTDQLIAYVRLYKALGGGWISEQERQGN